MTTLLHALATAGVQLQVQDGALRFRSFDGQPVPEELRQAITDHKPALLVALADPVPLDAAIAVSEAGRRSLREIETRLKRVKARSAQPAVTELDLQVAQDRTAIHRAKLAGEQAA